MNRRGFLRGGAAAAVGVAGGAWLVGCASSDEPEAERTSARSAVPSDARVLVAYFSRAGENYHYGGRRFLEVGNTEVLVGLIRDRISCDVHRIEAAEPYSEDYDDTVARNVREQNADARPAIANPLPDLAGYDVVLLGSGLWNVRPPMIMRTFAEGLDFTGKTVLPVVTYAVSGMGGAPDTYTEACPGATVGDGIAVRGEEVRDAGDDVTMWLRSVQLV
jgi:flavodoxin